MYRSASGTETGMARSVAVFSLDSGSLTYYIYPFPEQRPPSPSSWIPSGLSPGLFPTLPRRSPPSLSFCSFLGQENKGRKWTITLLIRMLQ